MATVTKPPALDETLQAVNDTLGEIRDALEGGGGGEYIPKVAGATAGNVPILKADGTLEDSGETIPSKTSDLINDSNFVSDPNYVHTDNNYTDEEKMNVGQITGIKNDLSQLDVHAKELQILGWQVPDGCPIQNEISGDNLIQKVNRHRIGDFEWGIYNNKFFTGFPDIAYYSVNIFCTKYETYPSIVGSSVPNGYIAKGSGTEIYIGDSNYTSAESFKNANADIWIYYEMATPVNHSISNNVGLSNEALDIKMLGWSVPKECPIQNYMDGNRKFHQRVGRIDLGSLDYAYRTVAYGTHYGFDSSALSFKPASDSNHTLNAYCKSYSMVSANQLYDGVTGLGNYSNNYITIINPDYTDASAFKSAMQGVYLYYELATEIVTSADGNEAIFNPLSGDLKFIAGRVNWNGVPEIFTIEQYSMYIVFVCTATQRAIYLVNGVGAQAAAVQVVGDSLASFSMNGFTVTANINRYCSYAIYRLTKDR